METIYSENNLVQGNFLLRDMRIVSEKGIPYLEGKVEIMSEGQHCYKRKFLYVLSPCSKEIKSELSGAYFYPYDQTYDMTLTRASVSDRLVKEITALMHEREEMYHVNRCWCDVNKYERWIKCTINTEYSREEYIVNANHEIEDPVFGITCPIKEVNGDLYKIDLSNNYYYVKRLEDFLVDCCYCDSYEVESIYELPKEDVFIIHNLLRKHENDEEYTNLDLSNDFCYHLKGKKTVNEIIENMASAAGTSLCDTNNGVSNITPINIKKRKGR